MNENDLRIEIFINECLERWAMYEYGTNLISARQRSECSNAEFRRLNSFLLSAIRFGQELKGENTTAKDSDCVFISGTKAEEFIYDVTLKNGKVKNE